MPGQHRAGHRCARGEAETIPYRKGKGCGTADEYERRRKRREQEASCQRKYFQPFSCRRLQPARMWHSLVKTLSNRMKRMTLLMYAITNKNTECP